MGTLGKLGENTVRDSCKHRQSKPNQDKTWARLRQAESSWAKWMGQYWSVRDSAGLDWDELDGACKVVLSDGYGWLSTECGMSVRG